MIRKIVEFLWWFKITNRKIEARVIKGNFLELLDKGLSQKVPAPSVQSFVVLPRLPILVNLERTIHRSHIKMLLYQLPEVLRIRNRLGRGVLNIYLGLLLALLYNPVMPKILSRIPRLVFKARVDGDFLFVSNTSVVSVNLSEKTVARYYLISNRQYLENEIGMRLKGRTELPELRRITEMGYEEEYISPDINIYEYIERVGQRPFFESVIDRMAILYNQTPGETAMLDQYISSLIRDLENSSISTWVACTPFFKLFERCRKIGVNRKVKLCTVHGDLGLDQFLVSRNRLYILDWEFTRIASPEVDFVSLMRSFNDFAQLLRGPHLFRENYMKGYFKLKNAIDCDCILTLREMIALYLLEETWTFYHQSADFGWSRIEFNNYPHRRVSNVVDLL